jgi:hypothetical protein
MAMAFPHLPRGATWFRLPGVFSIGGATATPIRILRFLLGAGWCVGQTYFIVMEVSMSKKSLEALSIIHPNAAGVDIGSREIWVALRPDHEGETTRCFATFTPDLHHLADWLVEHGVDTVAMESTGVYWIPLFEILEARGLQVYLVNARHVKHVPGRKSDVLDCQSPKGRRSALAAKAA